MNETASNTTSGTSAAAVAPAPDVAAAPDPAMAAIAGLPAHAQGLLKIRVPLRVTLAAQRKSIQEIRELGPGSILKFDKTCEEPLQLLIGDRPLANGAVVKVGDKFGLKISSIVR